jgi:hypothetical protein
MSVSESQREVSPALPHGPARHRPRPHRTPGINAPGDDQRADRMVRGLAAADWQGTAEGEFLEATRRDLTAHLGGVGNLSAVEKILVERAIRLALYISLMDRQAARDRTLSERYSRQYLAWSNSLVRTLAQMGIKGAAAAKPRELREYLKGEASR